MLILTAPDRPSGKRSERDYTWTEPGEVLYLISGSAFGGTKSRRATTIGVVADLDLTRDQLVEIFQESTARAIGADAAAKYRADSEAQADSVIAYAKTLASAEIPVGTYMTPTGRIVAESKALGVRTSRPRATR